MSAVHAHNLNMHHVVRRDDKCSMVFSLVYYKTKTRLKFVSVTFAFNVYLLLAKHFNCSSGLFRSIGISCQPSQPPVLAIAFAHLARYTQTHTHKPAIPLLVVDVDASIIFHSFTGCITIWLGKHCVKLV